MSPMTQSIKHLSVLRQNAQRVIYVGEAYLSGKDQAWKQEMGYECVQGHVKTNLIDAD